MEFLRVFPAKENLGRSGECPGLSAFSKTNGEMLENKYPVQLLAEILDVLGSGFQGNLGGALVSVCPFGGRARSPRGGDGHLYLAGIPARAVVEDDVVVIRRGCNHRKGDFLPRPALEQRTVDGGILLITLGIDQGDAGVAADLDGDSEGCVLRNIPQPHRIPAARRDFDGKARLGPGGGGSPPQCEA